MKETSMSVRHSVVERMPLLKPVHPSHRWVMLGSCFAQYMGQKMEQAGGNVVVNPLGTLFNPFSIAKTVHAALHAAEVDFPIFPADGEWRCWWANTRVKAPTPEALRQELRVRYEALGEALHRADHLVVTLGTNVCYLTPDPTQEHGEQVPLMVVTNCQRQPDRLFTEWRATQQEVVEVLAAMVEELLEVNASLQVILTVSPYRYAKYGYHGSQLSKAVLLLAEDELIRRFPQTCCYFPAYEILLDELRDYRYYASDGHHPAEEAVEHIWERVFSSS